MGDFNLDGYPDILTVVQNTTKGWVVVCIVKVPSFIKSLDDQVV